MRRAVTSAAASDPTATTEYSNVNVVSVPPEGLLHEQRHDHVEVHGERADDRHHHQRDEQVGLGSHVPQPGPDLALGGGVTTTAGRSSAGFIRHRATITAM